MRLNYREGKKGAAEPVTACGTGAPELALSVSRVQILAAAATAGQLTPDPRQGRRVTRRVKLRVWGRCFSIQTQLFCFNVTHVKKM